MYFSFLTLKKTLKNIKIHGALLTKESYFTVIMDPDKLFF